MRHRKRWRYEICNNNENKQQMGSYAWHKMNMALSVCESVAFGCMAKGLNTIIVFHSFNMFTSILICTIGFSIRHCFHIFAIFICWHVVIWFGCYVQHRIEFHISAHVCCAVASELVNIEIGVRGATCKHRSTLYVYKIHEYHI